ncbi:MAG TPA: EFR1 family ferrodoxin [Clostridiales bacterium]|nr:EFR1 family ferrodoxin [Clostridiales bacterium]
MIFYFSGTGNSLQVARNIAEHAGEKLISIAHAINMDDCCEYTLKHDEVIGFVYPVYAWSPPKIVLQFIEELKLNNYNDNYIFSIATCGDNIGNTMKVLEDTLSKKNLTLNSGFSVNMPNNYIIFFDVDSMELEKKKLSAAERTLEKINAVIAEKKKGVFEIEKGLFPSILTNVINPFFNKKAINTKKFYANEECTGCGLCEKVCNSRNINIGADRKPQWGRQCLQCMACLHYCPVEAIQYGKRTVHKGRYTNPYVSPEDISLEK